MTINDRCITCIKGGSNSQLKIKYQIKIVQFQNKIHVTKSKQSILERKSEVKKGTYM